MVAVVNGYPIRSVGTDMRSKYPNVCVTLIGEDENAFAIVERVQRALREAGVLTAEVKAFTVEACSGDYYHLLETVLRTVVRTRARATGRSISIETRQKALEEIPANYFPNDGGHGHRPGQPRQTSRPLIVATAGQGL